MDALKVLFSGNEFSCSVQMLCSPKKKKKKQLLIDHANNKMSWKLDMLKSKGKKAKEAKKKKNHSISPNFKEKKTNSKHF